MKRIAKPAGAYNIVVEEVEVPAIAPTEIFDSRRMFADSAAARRFGGATCAKRRLTTAPWAIRWWAESRRWAQRSKSSKPAIWSRLSRRTPNMWRSKSEPAGTSLRLCAYRRACRPRRAPSGRWEPVRFCGCGRLGPGRDDVMVIQGQGLVGSGCMQAAKAQGRGARHWD